MSSLSSPVNDSTTERRGFEMWISVPAADGTSVSWWRCLGNPRERVPILIVDNETKPSKALNGRRNNEKYHHYDGRCTSAGTVWEANNEPKETKDWTTTRYSNKCVPYDFPPLLGQPPDRASEMAPSNFRRFYERSLPYSNLST